jgi:pimeloyl-ACP methyl ester carboxylesterase
MNIVHRWFQSGAHSLMAHIDLPETPCESLGVLIVPPFGWEDTCSYRPLRFLGKALAASGMPALRFDLAGTGDSSGDALASGLLEAWIQSVNDAAAELRAATGVEDVAVVGIRLGAMLAVSAANRGADLQDLVLWGPTATGRTMLRELRAFSSMERIEYANGERAPEQPIPGLEIGGFLVSAETQNTLETFGLTDLRQMRRRRVLLLTRDELALDAKLTGALRLSGCTVEVQTGSGYAAMMGLPHEAVPPAATAGLIVEFLAKGIQQKREREVGAGGVEIGLTERSKAPHGRAVIKSGDAQVSETVYTVRQSANSLFGILSEPGPNVQPAEFCVLFLNAGAVRHTGPNRMWVEAARRWATQGVRSLRLDLAGIGESDGEPTLGTERLYQDHMVDQIEIVMDSLRARLGVRQFVVIGLCSGAFWAFHAAIRNRDICAAILLNPRLFFWDPEVDRRRLLRRTLTGLGEWKDWRRLAQGDVPIERIKQLARIALDKIQTADGNQHLQIQPEAMARAWAAIERNQSRVTLIFTEGEPLIREMAEEGQMPPQNCSRVRCLQVGNGGHTFRPLWAQKLAHELIDGELREVLRGSLADPTYEGHEKQCAVTETWHR